MAEKGVEEQVLAMERLPCQRKAAFAASLNSSVFGYSLAVFPTTEPDHLRKIGLYHPCVSESLSEDIQCCGQAFL